MECELILFIIGLVFNDGQQSLIKLEQSFNFLLVLLIKLLLLLDLPQNAFNHLLEFLILSYKGLHSYN